MTVEYFILNFGPYLVFAVGLLSGAYVIGKVLVIGKGKNEEEATNDMIERCKFGNEGILIKPEKLDK